MFGTQHIRADESVAYSGAESLIDADETLVELACIVGQLDPSELDDTGHAPRWTDEQRRLILAAGNLIEEWK